MRAAKQASSSRFVPAKVDLSRTIDGTHPANSVELTLVDGMWL